MLLSVEQYHILCQELVLKVYSILLVAPPVAPPLRTDGAAPSLAAHQRSTQHTNITELQKIILSGYLMLKETYTLLFMSGENLTKQTSLSIF